MSFLGRLFAAEELPDTELHNDILETLPLGAHYEVDTQGRVVGIYYPGDEDPDEYDEGNSTGFADDDDFDLGYFPE